MKHRGNTAFTLATAASLGLSLGIGNIAAAEAQTSDTTTNKVTGQLKIQQPGAVSKQTKTTGQDATRLSTQGKLSNQYKLSTQGKHATQGKMSSQHKITVPEKVETH